MKLLKKIIEFKGKVSYIIFRLKCRKASPNGLAELYRDKFYYLGKGVELYNPMIGTEPYLISIHDNVVCAGGVRFINHDISCFRMAKYLGIDNSEVDKVGSIELFDNCFVGSYTILMPNTSVGRNSVVAAGSVVTKHIPDGEVWGGVPAKFIMTTDEYAKNIYTKSKEFPWKLTNRKLSNEELIQMRQDYFFKTEK